MGKTRGRKTPPRPIGSHNNACLYASWFLHASITIMATVCRFSPSQLVGEVSAGSRDCQRVLSLPTHPQRQTGLLIAYLTGAYVHLICSMPVFPPFQRLGVGRFKRPAQNTHMKVSFAAAC